MRLERLHPGVTVADVAENTGFELIIPSHLPVTEPPEEGELEMLRSLDPDGRYI